jgi:ABC-type multidrug transport system fused ATPase/permease subunit
LVSRVAPHLGRFRSRSRSRAQGLWTTPIGGWTVFKHVPSTLLFGSLLLVQLQLVSFSICIGQMFVSSTRAFVFTLLLWLITHALLFRHSDGEHLVMELSFCATPFFALVYVLRLLFLSDRSMRDVHVSRTLYSWTPSLAHLFASITASIGVYWLLVWLCETRLRGDDETCALPRRRRRRPHFDVDAGRRDAFAFGCSRSFRSSGSRSPADTRRSTLPGDVSSDDDDDGAALVRIGSLTKRFEQDDDAVLQSVSLDLFANEITALLGHNGAGSSSLHSTRWSRCSSTRQDNDDAAPVWNVATDEWLDPDRSRRRATRHRTTSTFGQLLSST